MWARWEIRRAFRSFCIGGLGFLLLIVGVYQGDSRHPLLFWYVIVTSIALPYAWSKLWSEPIWRDDEK